MSRNGIESGRFGDIGDRAVSMAVAAGISNTLDLEKIRDNSIKERIYQIGRDTEERFVNYVFEHHSISFVRTSSHADDIEQGVDFWIKLNPKYRLPLLPVQVKSSRRDVKKFINNDPKYSKAREAILVLNCGPSVTKQKLLKELEDEIKRVREIFMTNPHHEYIVPMTDQHE